MNNPSQTMTNTTDPLAWFKGNWHYPTEIVFGCGSRHRLIEHAKSLNISRPLFVTDRGLATLDMTAEIVDDLRVKGAHVDIFSDVQPNPTGQNVTAGVKVYHQGRHDGVIVMGGGSALDVGKAIALMVGQTEEIWSFEDEGNNWEKVNVDGMAPVIAMPSTAGTGSEVGRSSVILDESARQKKIIFHPNMLPALVVIDPEITVGLPPAITAATGVDAFIHNLEAFCVESFHPMADGIALEGMRLIKENLPIAYQCGDNITARSQLLVASMMGATAFQKGLGGVHALAHPLGALYDKHHGLLNAILLPYVLKRNEHKIAEKLAQIAKFIGLDNPSYDTFMEWVLLFREQLGLPHTLSSIGLDDAESIQIGRMASVDPAASGNPLPLTPSDYTEIYCNAVSGRL